jgi:phage gpG-like protein
MPSIRTNFEQQGRPSWAPLSQATLNRRRWSGEGVTNRILSRTAALRRRASSFKIWTIREDAAYVSDLGQGSGGVPWAKLHQECMEGGGEAIGRIIRRGVPQVPSATFKEGDEIVESYGGDIPARPFLVIQPEDEEKMGEIFSEWVGRTFVAHGWPVR